MGGGHPVTVQTMLSGNKQQPEDMLGKKLELLRLLGCDILRSAVPDMKSVEYIDRLSRLTAMPVVADIHYDYHIALAVLDTGIAKLRLNPGNLGPAWKTEEVLHKAMDRHIPVRVGINGGSLPQNLRKNPDKAESMVLAAEEEMEIMEKTGFHDAVFSLKSSDIETTCRANRRFSEKYDYPLHLGITEAGPLIEGIVKSTIAFTRLLSGGIGSTIRVSLTDSEENEVIAGRAVLTSLGLSAGISIVSCPRCGRSTFDTHGFLHDYGDRIRTCGKNVSVAVMGCTVNGPEEAASADLGITGSGKKAVIFKHGRVLGEFSPEEAGEKFLEELEKL